VTELSGAAERVLVEVVVGNATTMAMVEEAVAVGVVVSAASVVLPREA
jgi:hypothetical protein